MGGWEEAGTYREIFQVSGRHGVLSPEEEEEEALERMAGFRNILIHEYDRVDKAAVFGILKRGLGDFRLFGERVKEFAKKGFA